MSAPRKLTGRIIQQGNGVANAGAASGNATTTTSTTTTTVKGRVLVPGNVPATSNGEAVQSTAPEQQHQEQIKGNRCSKKEHFKRFFFLKKKKQTYKQNQRFYFISSYHYSWSWSTSQ